MPITACSCVKGARCDGIHDLRVSSVMCERALGRRWSAQQAAWSYGRDTNLVDSELATKSRILDRFVGCGPSLTVFRPSNNVLWDCSQQRKDSPRLGTCLADHVDDDKDNAEAAFHYGIWECVAKALSLNVIAGQTPTNVAMHRRVVDMELTSILLVAQSQLALRVPPLPPKSGQRIARRRKRRLPVFAQLASGVSVV